MENNNNNSRVPKLRFPGFTGEWSIKELSKVLTNRRVLQKISDAYPLLSFTSDSGVIDGASRNIDRSFLTHDKDNKKYLLTKVDDIVYNPANLKFGAIHRNSFKDGVVSPIYVTLETKENPIFIDAIVTSSSFRREALKFEEGTVVARQAVSPDDLLSMHVSIPSPEEQQKIAECLTEMDNLISAQSQKVESLKNHKKGLMQQLFPQPGENTPKLRFPGFEGEWDYVNGDELFDSISNKDHNSDLPILALTQDRGAVPRDEINYNVIVSEKSVAGYKVVEVDDFIISLRSFQGGIEYSRYKGLCSPAYIVLRKKDKKLSSDFYRIYFKSFNYIQELNKNLEGIRDGKMISYKQFSEIKLPKPSPSEQQKIAECLSELDKDIEEESAKLEALKSHKKGLMQQLFPEPIK